MNIQTLIKKSRNKKDQLHKKRIIFVSDYDEWLKGVEAHVKHKVDESKFFIDITNGVHRAFFVTDKVGVWGGVLNNGYYFSIVKLKHNNGYVPGLFSLENLF